MSPSTQLRLVARHYNVILSIGWHPQRHLFGWFATGPVGWFHYYLGRFAKDAIEELRRLARIGAFMSVEIKSEKI